MNSKGGLTDLFLFMIFAFVLVLFSGIFIYIGATATSSLHAELDTMDIGGESNTTDIINNTIGKANSSYGALYWISIFLIFGMAIAIFIGSYLVTTKPIFFIPYLFIVIIATIVAVPISNAYQTILNNETLGATFEGFLGSSWILGQLPLIVVTIGIVGGIIMFVRLGRKEEFSTF